MSDTPTNQFEREVDNVLQGVIETAFNADIMPASYLRKGAKTQILAAAERLADERVREVLERLDGKTEFVEFVEGDMRGMRGLALPRRELTHARAAITQAGQREVLERLKHEHQDGHKYLNCGEAIDAELAALEVK